jgi:hypothetical protein
MDEKVRQEQRLDDLSTMGSMVAQNPSRRLPLRWNVRHLRPGSIVAILQEMPGFGHLVTLFNLCYDKGSRVMAMIENRIGGERFCTDFLRVVVTKYRYRILRVADFRRELEAYCGPVDRRTRPTVGNLFHELAVQGWPYGLEL